MHLPKRAAAAAGLGDGDEAPKKKRKGALTQEVINTPFCPYQEKFHTFVLRGVRNISEAP